MIRFVRPAVLLILAAPFFGVVRVFRQDAIAATLAYERTVTPPARDFRRPCPHPLQAERSSSQTRTR